MATTEMKVIDEFQKNVFHRIVASLNELVGRKFIDIRMYYLDDNGEYKPTRRGITVSIDKYARFKEMMEKIDEAVQKEIEAA